jgi:hypothetical protein
MDFEALAQKIESATRAAFKEMFQQHGGEDIYAFALYSDEGAMTVCPSTNTVAFLNGLSAEAKEELPYYKFEPAEWAYEMQGADDAFNQISKALYTELTKNSYQNEYEEEAVFDTFRQGLYDCCIAVLEKLKAEDFFNSLAGKEIFLLFTASEYEFPKSELADIVKRLNNDVYEQEYLAWMKTWSA